MLKFDVSCGSGCCCCLSLLMMVCVLVRVLIGWGVGLLVEDNPQPRLERSPSQPPLLTS